MRVDRASRNHKSIHSIHNQQQQQQQQQQPQQQQQQTTVSFDVFCFFQPQVVINKFIDNTLSRYRPLGPKLEGKDLKRFSQGNMNQTEPTAGASCLVRLVGKCTVFFLPERVKFTWTNHHFPSFHKANMWDVKPMFLLAQKKTWGLWFLVQVVGWLLMIIGKSLLFTSISGTWPKRNPIFFKGRGVWKKSEEIKRDSFELGRA